MIVATFGFKGNVAFFENNSNYQEAVDVDEITDTTGCGNSFQAVFRIEWIHTKYIRESLNAEAIAASIVLEFIGGIE